MKIKDLRRVPRFLAGIAKWVIRPVTEITIWEEDEEQETGRGGLVMD